MSQCDVVVIGNIIKETIKFTDRTVGPVLGSPAAYSSLVTASAGTRTGIVSFYGNDMPNEIKELNIVDRAGLIEYPYSTTNLLTYNADGTKFVQYVKQAPSLEMKHIPESYLTAQFFHVCPMDYEVDLNVVETLQKMGKTVLVDLGGYGGATSDIRYSIDTPRGKSTIDRICNSGCMVKASGEDLQSIFPGRSPEEAGLYMKSKGSSVVVITLGADGAMYSDENGEFQVMPNFIATVADEGSKELDFTGAGDSFDGGFMAAISESKNIAEAVEFGNATASLVIEMTGGCLERRMPEKNRIVERIVTQRCKISNS